MCFGVRLSEVVCVCVRQYSKKEVKKQLGYAANISGSAQSRPDDYSVASRSVLNRCVFACPFKSSGLCM